MAVAAAVRRLERRAMCTQLQRRYLADGFAYGERSHARECNVGTRLPHRWPSESCASASRATLTQKTTRTPPISDPQERTERVLLLRRVVKELTENMRLIALTFDF